jgi:hypothetical protein
MPDEVARAKQAGFLRHLPKPIVFTESVYNPSTRDTVYGLAVISPSRRWLRS